MVNTLKGKLIKTVIKSACRAKFTKEKVQEYLKGYLAFETTVTNYSLDVDSAYFDIVYVDNHQNHLISVNIKIVK
jgi:tRNA(His) 5'-end guanylyltransferase